MPNHTQKSMKAVSSKLALCNPDAAGIDIGSKEHYVAVSEGRAEASVKKFACLTPDLHQMAHWLSQCQIKTIAMESTGVYWVPVVQVLEQYGFEVLLVDARQVRNVSGRKSDVQDCQWIQQLHSYGLLAGAFRPDTLLQPLRSYWRQRASLIEQAVTQIHHMQKALELMNLQLHKVLADVTGTSGLRILRAIIRGEHDPEKLVTLCTPNVKNPKHVFIKALTGYYRDEHLFALRQAIEIYDTFQEKIIACDQHIERYTQTLDAQATPEAVDQILLKKAPGRKRRNNRPTFDLRRELIRITGVDLTVIDGINDVTAMTIISEQGIDMTRFPTEKHFASHLGLCPNNQITGGRIKKRRTKRVQSRAAQALRMAAQSLHRSQSALGAYYRRMRAHKGAPKAITAAAHKLAKIVYRMLAKGQDYVDQGQQLYEQKYQQHQLKRLVKNARKMGYELIQLDTGEVVS